MPPPASAISDLEPRSKIWWHPQSGRHLEPTPTLTLSPAARLGGTPEVGATLTEMEEPPSEEISSTIILSTICFRWPYVEKRCSLCRGEGGRKGERGGARGWGARGQTGRGTFKYWPTGYEASGVNSHCGKRKYDTRYRPGAATAAVQSGDIYALNIILPTSLGVASSLIGDSLLPGSCFTPAPP